MRRMAWNDQAAQALAGAAGSPEELAEVGKEVETGDAQLFQFEGKPHGYLVLRLEETPTGRRELVLVLGAGSGARELIALAKDWANQVGADSIRTHVSRPGLIRLYERQGFEQAHVVMTWSPSDG